MLCFEKKSFVFLFLCLLGLSSLFANLNYKLDFVSFKPLHKEYFADRGRPEFSINYLTYYEGYPDRVLQDVYTRHETDANLVKVWEFEGNHFKPKDSMIQVKLGETMALARNTISFDSWLSPIAFDFSMQGLLQSFYLGGFDDNVGYDGIYFFGANIRIADVVSMRIGRQHYCSHYGDAIIKSIKDNDRSYASNT